MLNLGRGFQIRKMVMQCGNYSVSVKTAPVLGERASIVKSFSEEDVRQFAALTGDFNPLHLDAQSANKTGIFQKPIVHAALLNGLVSGVIGNQLPGPGCAVVLYSARYPAPLYVGDTVRVEVVVTSIKKKFVELGLECSNLSGDEVRKVMLGKCTVLRTEI